MAWQAVAEAAAVAADEAIGVTVGSAQIAIVNDGERLYALDNVCTHQYALLSDGFVEDGCIECPLHQGRFELATGKAMCAPVTTPVRVYPVKVEGGKVYVDLG